MRRILTAIALIAAGIAAVTATAGADDTHTYNIEMYNAFGLVQGSDVRIAGVNAGTVRDLSITPQKTARVEVELSGEFGTLGKDTKCSSEPQSLIAEYYITCEPAGPPLPDGGTIPASQVSQTVQNDLVQDTLREPFKQSFALLINEFGTALAGNPERLNEAIRLGAPAITQLHKITSILASQNQIITDLNQNSDKVIGQLAARREDVVRFIQRATDTADASLARRDDLSRDFEILDDFLAELQPTLAKLDEVARANTPLLTDLRAAAPGLNRLAVNLPAFSQASDASLTSLGHASTVGTTALHRGADEIRLLAESGKKAPKTGEILADFLRDLDDPRRAVEIDDRVPKDTGRSDPRPNQKDTKGYTGLEGLLNYAYYQPGALNQFDQVGHLLHFTLYYIFTGPCGQFNSGHDPNTGAPGVPAKNGGTTTNILDAADCVGWLGPNQPGINESLHLPPYDPSVCPNGTEPAAALKLCNPAGSNSNNSNDRRHESGNGGTEPTDQGQGNGDGGGAPDTGDGSTGDQGGGSGGPDLPGQLPDDILDQILNLPPSAIDDLPQSVQDQLGLGSSGQSGSGQSGGGSGAGTGAGTGAGAGAAGDLLDFLFTTP
jgi:virulence factor Mce-like protein